MSGLPCPVEALLLIVAVGAFFLYCIIVPEKKR
jgi:hypothetical protein